MVLTMRVEHVAADMAGGVGVMRRLPTGPSERRAWFTVAAALVAASSFISWAGVTRAAAASMLAWTKLSPKTSPRGRLTASMAYDPATGQLVLFGGVDRLAPPSFLSTTWDWSGSTWTKLSPTTSPAARSAASMAYDPATGQLVLFGGADRLTTRPTTPSALSTTWDWNGTTWTRLSPAASPPGLADASMVYDLATRQLILFGGQVGTGGTVSTTWTWNGTTWTELSPPTSPPARLAASMAYDPATGQLVLFGGTNDVVASNALSTTWTWNGTTWTELSPPTSPPARLAASIAYDPATRQLVLFGGQVGTGGIVSTTWTWNGTTWTELSPPTSPAARLAASMADDPAAGQLVLFGGLTVPSSVLSTTWVLHHSTSGSTPKAYPPGLLVALRKAVGSTFPVDELVFSYKVDHDSSSWVFWQVQGAPGYQTTVQPGSGFAHRTSTGWRVWGPGTNAVGCSAQRGLGPVPTTVLRAFGETCSHEQPDLSGTWTLSGSLTETGNITGSPCVARITGTLKLHEVTPDTYSGPLTTTYAYDAPSSNAGCAYFFEPGLSPTSTHTVHLEVKTTGVFIVLGTGATPIRMQTVSKDRMTYRVVHEKTPTPNPAPTGAVTTSPGPITFTTVGVFSHKFE
jgi:hypothetical protein